VLTGSGGLANYVCVPTVTLALVLCFNPYPMVAAGFLILAVCPGAPFIPPFATVARGNIAIAVALMAMLAGSSAVIARIRRHCGPVADKLGGGVVLAVRRPLGDVSPIGREFVARDLLCAYATRPVQS
jgi:hypothetical protein